MQSASTPSKIRERKEEGSTFLNHTSDTKVLIPQHEFYNLNLLECHLFSVKSLDCHSFYFIYQNAIFFAKSTVNTAEIYGLDRRVALLQYRTI
jgi:hypothetical protein